MNLPTHDSISRVYVACHSTEGLSTLVELDFHPEPSPKMGDGVGGGTDEGASSGS